MYDDTDRPIVSVSKDADPAFWLGVLIAGLAARSTTVRVEFTEDSPDDFSGVIYVELDPLIRMEGVLVGSLIEEHAFLGGEADTVEIDTQHIANVTIV